MANRIIGALFLRACNTGETIGPIELPSTNRFLFMPSVTELSRTFAGLADLTLLLFGHSTAPRSGACQSFEAVFNLEAGMRYGLTLEQAKAIINEDG